MRIHSRARIIEIRSPLPRLLNPLRKMAPHQKPRDPSATWLLLLRRSSSRATNGKSHRFHIEPLFIGPEEREEYTMFPGSHPTWTYLDGKILNDQVIFQNLHVKPSWRRQGVMQNMLLRAHEHFLQEGSPAIEGSFSESGWATAAHMRDAYAWAILGSPPPQPKSLPVLN